MYWEILNENNALNTKLHYGGREEGNEVKMLYWLEAVLIMRVYLRYCIFCLNKPIRLSHFLAREVCLSVSKCFNNECLTEVAELS